MQHESTSKTPAFIKRGGPLVYATPAYSTYSSLSSSSNPPSGSVRFYSADGRKHIVLRLAEGTKVAELCAKHKAECVYLQIGNLQLRQLHDSDQPLKIQKQFLQKIGHSREEALELGADLNFRHLFAFFLGRPTLQTNSSIRSEILITECAVRRGKVVHRWGRNKCILYNGTIRIHKDSGENEVVHLSRMRAELYNSRRGKCLRLTDATSIYLFLFDDDETLRLWLSRSQQNEHSSTYDLSDQRLILLPEALLNSNDILQLNLRRNSLMTRPQSGNLTSGPIGTVEDVSRLLSLISLDLSFNNLHAFPFSIVHLAYLRILNLSSNCITELPSEIGSMSNLSTLILSNNWLSNLPPEIAECQHLTQLDLSFNRFDQIPDILSSFSNIVQWQLAGNCIESVGCHPSALQVINSLNLRRNYLSSSFRLPNVTYSHLTAIDIRDNAHISTVFLTNIPSLQVLHCERLQLTSLHVNGQSLVELHADHNLLDTLVIMPVPLHLTLLSLSHNHFDSLPEWIADLPQLVQLQVNNNKLSALPERLFLSSSLRYLIAYNNELQTMPQEIGESALETLILYNNKIQNLPNDFFKRCIRLRHVNLSSNRLASLPQAHPNTDMNRIQIFRCANNQLTECCLPVIVGMKRLRILDLSNNEMSYFDDSALHSLSLLEEISLSDNRLSRLSPSLPLLPSLQILRAHSNAITEMPEIANSLTLQLVDLSGNLLSLRTALSPGPALRHLDVSCNPGVELSESSIRSPPSRPISFVDVTDATKTNFHFGYSDTNGSKAKMCIRRLQAGPSMALIDGGQNYEIAKKVVGILKNEMEIPDFEKVPLRRILLNCHELVGEMAERLGASVLLLKVSKKVEITSCGSIGAAILSNGTYKILIESRSGLDEEEYERLRDADAFVNEDNYINGISKYSRLIGHYASYPAILPAPTNVTYELDGNTDSLLVASSALFERVNNKQIAQILASTANPLIAAKRLQDTLQSYDYSGNSSITVVKFEKPSKIFKSENGNIEEEQPPLVCNANQWSRNNNNNNATLESRDIPPLRVRRASTAEDESLHNHVYESIQQNEDHDNFQRPLSPDISSVPPDDPKSLSDASMNEITATISNLKANEDNAKEQDASTIVEVSSPLTVTRRSNFGLTSAVPCQNPIQSQFSSSYLTPTELSFSSKYRFEYARSQLSSDLRLEPPNL